MACILAERMPALFTTTSSRSRYRVIKPERAGFVDDHRLLPSLPFRAGAVPRPRVRAARSQYARHRCG
jgi:hypothetical protein